MDLRLKVDSKGRICIPLELRKEIGDVVILRRTPEGFIIVPGKPVDFIEEFRKTVTSEPPRTGKPENWPPSRMKAMWRAQ
ncbi:MAG: AbrB/MazE/SpoVT family DNA-binding domain-containing protein [Candidatus Bathyarchaeia archaeon]